MTVYDEAVSAAETLCARLGVTGEVAIVLGSGLGGVADRVTGPRALGYEEIPHWPRTSVAGHAGRVVAGRLRGREVLVLAGRVHLYEGGGPAVVTFAVRVLGLLGVRVLILTSAAGGLQPALLPGALVVLDDHMNLTGLNPLSGPHDARLGARFPDMTEVYAARLRTLADQAAVAAGISLAHGIYAGVLGPSYETPAEIRALRTLGADLVGMSTVHEAIAARQMGMDVLGVSCVTNLAAGLGGSPLAHDDVLDGGVRGGPQLAALLEEIIGRL